VIAEEKPKIVKKKCMPIAPLMLHAGKSWISSSGIAVEIANSKDEGLLKLRRSMGDEEGRAKWKGSLDKSRQEKTLPRQGSCDLQDWENSFLQTHFFVMQAITVV
jgi:hypothetical protein